MRQPCEFCKHQWAGVLFAMKDPSSILCSKVWPNQVMFLLQSECDMSCHEGTTETELVFTLVSTTFMTDVRINTARLLIYCPFCLPLPFHALPHYLPSILHWFSLGFLKKGTASTCMMQLHRSMCHLYTNRWHFMSQDTDLSQSKWLHLRKHWHLIILDRSSTLHI